MPKLLFSASMGSGRPFLLVSTASTSLTGTFRHLSVSAICSDEHIPAARAPSQSTIRRRDSTREVQKLLDRASSETPSRQRWSASRSTTLDRNVGDAGPVDARALAATSSNASLVVRRTSFGSGGRGQPDSSRPAYDGRRPQPSGSRPNYGDTAYQDRDRRDKGTFRGGRGGGRGGARGRFSGQEPARRRRRNGGDRDDLLGGVEEQSTDEGAIFEMDQEEWKKLVAECKDVDRVGAQVKSGRKMAEISEVGLGSLVGLGPAILLGQRGMGEIVEEKLNRLSGNSMIDNAIRLQELARRLRAGDFVRFRNSAEKDATFELAKIVAEREADVQTDASGEIAGVAKTTFEAIPEETRDKVTRQLLEGSYKLVEGKQDTVQELLIKLRRNETISPLKEDAMARKIRSLLPAQRAARPIRVAPKEAASS